MSTRQGNEFGSLLEDEELWDGSSIVGGVATILEAAEAGGFARSVFCSMTTY